MKLKTVLAALCCVIISFGCTYAVTNVLTDGNATDVVDETSENTPSATITPLTTI